jgi:hypothetical protein
MHERRTGKLHPETSSCKKQRSSEPCNRIDLPLVGADAGRAPARDAMDVDMVQQYPMPASRADGIRSAHDPVGHECIK